MHDTTDMEIRGIPSAFIATVEFTGSAVAQAKALGSDPAAIYTQHPIQDRTDEEMITIADDILDEVLSGLVEVEA